MYINIYNIIIYYTRIGVERCRGPTKTRHFEEEGEGPQSCALPIDLQKKKDSKSQLGMVDLISQKTRALRISTPRAVLLRPKAQGLF